MVVTLSAHLIHVCVAVLELIFTYRATFQNLLLTAINVLVLLFLRPWWQHWEINLVQRIIPILGQLSLLMYLRLCLLVLYH